MKYAAIYPSFHDREGFNTAGSSKPFVIMNRTRNSVEKMACVEDLYPRRASGLVQVQQRCRDTRILRQAGIL
jgi:hypothetical protein